MSDKVQIRYAESSDQSAWDDYVMQHAQASFFHRFGWKTVIEQAFSHKTFFLIAQRQQQLVGVLPLAQIKSRLFGHSLSSLPFCVYGGVLADSPEVAQQLDQAADTLARELKVDYLEYRCVQPQHSDWPTKSLYVTFRKQILPEVEANMKAIPRKQRAMVRKGIKAGLVSELDNHAERFFPVFADNVHRHGTPALPKRYFDLLFQVFGQDCQVLNAVHQGQVVSSVLSFYFRNEVLPYYAGDLLSARALAANDFKYWELMRRACEQGLEVFDYGRSKQGTGPYNFKKNWGFEPQPLHYEFQLYAAEQIPDTNPLNPKYQLFIKMWRRLPLSVANTLGPMIVKNLG